MEQTQTKRIVLGITGGIAAYKAAELTRLLIKQDIVNSDDSPFLVCKIQEDC